MSPTANPIPTSLPPRIAAITGSRADFGLLKPVMRAIGECDQLELLTYITGVHLLPDINTANEVLHTFPDARKVPMQQAGETGRTADAVATGRGIENFSRAFSEDQPDIVLVLGDRIEAFAAAGAASISGIRVAHIHGGDRAEGVADDSMRHAITKLAHMHFPATEQSAQRIIRLGEDPQWVFNVGSPAAIGLNEIEPLTNEQLSQIVGHDVSANSSIIVVMQHPTGLSDDDEGSTMQAILHAVDACEKEDHNLIPVIMAPNHDPGRNGVMRAISESNRKTIAHLKRPTFISLLKRAKVLVGNSSAGLIECAILRTPVVNIGPRQNGRERGLNLIDLPTGISKQTVQHAVWQAMLLDPPKQHPYGNGQTHRQIAEILSSLHKLPRDQWPSIRKRITY